MEKLDSKIVEMLVDIAAQIAVVETKMHELASKNDVERLVLAHERSCQATKKKLLSPLLKGLGALLLAVSAALAAFFSN
jgi:hypothetical protein